MICFPSLRQRLKTSLWLLGFFCLTISVSIYIPFFLSILIGIVFVLSLYEWTCCFPRKSYLMGILCLTFGFSCFQWLLIKSGWRGCIYVLLLAMTTDMIAYLMGCMIRGPKLCPSVSPHKTWAGALSSLCFTPWIGGMIFLILWPCFSFFRGFSVSFILCIAAQLGDLAESWLKRSYGVKDTGTLLPGHGGVLDRIDSWLATVTIAVIFSLAPPL